MADRQSLVWPPKVGQRIYFDTGHKHNSWSAEVRAIVDDDYAVVKRWRKRKGWHTYEVLDRLGVEAFNESPRGPRYFVGSLPRKRAA